MDEHACMNVTAMRAVETGDVTRALWSDDERAWASRAAAEVVGAEASSDAFLARRAALLVERLGARQPVLLRTLRALQWRPWAAWTLVAGAFALGIFVDQIDPGQRVNILAPPVLGLIAWNVSVYFVIVASYVVRYGEDAAPGLLRRAVARAATRLSSPRRSGALREVMIALSADWARRSAPLYAARAGRILHLSAAALAGGVIAGMYLRGIALEYRASWQSTFFDPPIVQAIAAIAYAPGAYLTGIAVPDAAAIAAIRAPLSENAARWLHLMAGTLFALVIAPRLLLASASGLVERHRSRRLGAGFDDGYFQRLLRDYRGGPSRIVVIPYSYTPTAANLAGLQSVLARALGASRNAEIAPVVPYGADAAFADAARRSDFGIVVVLFTASATPEQEVHGAFLSQLRADGAHLHALLALVDESALRERWQDHARRLAERRGSWQRLADSAHVAVVFVDLAAPDLTAAESAIDAALAQLAQ